MLTAIIASEKEPTGLNIKARLLSDYGFEKTDEVFESNEVYRASLQGGEIRLYTVKKDCINCEDIDKEIEAELFIFASIHKSKANIPSFAVHPVGNWGKPELGGKERMLVPAPALMLKEALKALHYANDIGFEVFQEATHHGPFLSKPAMFIEIGSTEKEWKDEKAGKIVADTIMKLAKMDSDIDTTSAIGIGGLHHTPGFRKLMLESDISVGHVCPKYALHLLDEEMLRKAMSLTVPETKTAVVDWKSMGAEKQRVVNLINDLGISYVKV